MTRLRWTPRAAVDFERLVERIRAENPAAAHRTARRIYQAIELLKIFPTREQLGLISDEIIDDQVHVLRIRHGAQDYGD